VGVDIAARVASAPGPVLRVCARHGQTATRHDPVLFRSRPPTWAYLLLPLGLIPFAIVATVLQKRIKAPAWPFCNECTKLRQLRMVAGIALLFLTVVVPFSVIAAAPESGLAGVFAVVLFAALLLSGLALATGAGRAVIASGYATPDGTQVRIRNPHPHFAQDARDMQPRQQPAQI
jgi:hypothetical protein